MIKHILVVGKTFREKYITSFLTFLKEGEPYKVFVLPEYYSKELEDSVNNLKLELVVINDLDKEYEFNSVLFFTDDINITEVMTLTDYLALNIPVTFINSK